MSKRNAHDFRCAQEVHWLNRDGEMLEEPAPVPLPHVGGVVRRRGRTETRVGFTIVSRPPMPMSVDESRAAFGLVRR